jgi:hypothetical protein
VLSATSKANQRNFLKEWLYKMRLILPQNMMFSYFCILSDHNTFDNKTTACTNASVGDTEQHWSWNTGCDLVHGRTKKG